MTSEEKQRLLDKIDIEGFDYCFLHYSSFKEIKDKKFHKLRESFVKAAIELEKYIKGEEK